MKKLYAIVGPTASGKTRMGVEVARAIGAEIVSCDSMAVYRGLDIVAAKPSLEEQGGVPHHLMDIAEPDEDITAVQYRDIARRVIDEVDVPLLVGGSGLWFRAVVDDLDFAPTSAAVRERLDALDAASLYEELRAADPQRAAAIDPRNKRRLVRAVEILELTGRPPSELRTSWERRCGPYAVTVVGLTWDRAELFARATARIHHQIERGMVDEVRRSVLSRTARQALGVKEMLEFIEGRATLDEAAEHLIRNTKRFIRRQESWFRADPRIEWINLSQTGWNAAREEIAARFAPG